MSGKNKKNRKQKKRTQRRSAGPERMISSQMYAYRRTCSYDVNINPASGYAGAGNNLNLVFSLNQVSFIINGIGAGVVSFPSSSEFTSLFDQYQFRSVEVDVYWSKNVAAESGTNATQPMIWSCFDYDDAANTALTAIEQYPAVKSTILGENGGKVLQMRLVPRARMEMPDGAGGTAFAPTISKNPWIDCSYPSVEHYGVKTYLDTFGRTSSLDIGTIKFVIRAEWMFAHPR